MQRGLQLVRGLSLRGLSPILGIALAAALFAPAAPAADWVDLMKNGLEDWEILGDGVWKLRSDGVVTAHRKSDHDELFADGEPVTKRQFHQWHINQSWLYTKKTYGEFDLHLEYWVRDPGNSGISIRDPSKAEFGIRHPPDFKKTPSKLGYEIQINSNWPDKWATGSIYGLAAAKPGLQREGEWNSLNIESRKDSIKVYINGILAAEHPGDPNRPLMGPIGLQLHDQSSVVMFRQIWLLER